MLSRWWLYSLFVVLTLGLVCAGVLALAVAFLYPNLPSLDALTDYRPKVPLQVHTADGHLIGEFGEERRFVVKIEAVPKLMKQAILAAEDDRFYEHRGVDYQGVMRAALANFMAGGVREGASTITMQVARTFFLTNERTFSRKLSEILLALKIERSLSKDQILELYVNQIFLGQRAYGFGAAAQIYYAKTLEQLTVAEAAMLAGLPKAPSKYNPIINPKRAALRQQYVLRRMRELDMIDEAQFSAALERPGKIAPQAIGYEVRADFLAEMARQHVFANYGEKAYTGGYRIITTISSAHQEAANAGLQRGVLDYDRRHGYRGPEGAVKLSSGEVAETELEDFLDDREAVGPLIAAVVLDANPTRIKAYVRGGQFVTIAGEGLRLAQRSLARTASQALRITRGSIIRVWRTDKGEWMISQRPVVEAAFVSLDPRDGRVLSLVGGFDFYSNKFNHVTQALRQPGSSFKPFVYSAALEKNFTPATVLDDAPFAIDPEKTGGELWEPKNFKDQYSGPMRLRTALAKSKNMVSIRIIDSIGPKYAQDYVTTRFGFDPKTTPPYLTMALGAGHTTVLQLAAGYAVFANQGYRVEPYFIDKILDSGGNVLVQTQPKVVGKDAEQILDRRNAFIMTSMMRDVINYGTATKARALARQDLAGKTGTTNDQRDAWFAGYHPTLVAVAWIGFDTPTSLGDEETGGHAALPMWVAYMGKALKGVPEAKLKVPEGVVTIPINPLTGLRDPEGEERVAEYFYRENTPPLQPPPEMELGPEDAERSIEEIKDQLF